LCVAQQPGFSFDFKMIIAPWRISRWGIGIDEQRVFEGRFAGAGQVQAACPS
jgi:hypothetical protein